ncbi:MAG TPA: FAD-binding oxidoreductase [Lunatimonas sp.]|nr:FAD-binding oxidoreductase [Lunatimonas sp.]
MVQLELILGKESILTGDLMGERSHHIWHLDQPLQGLAVVFPQSPRQVAQIMTLCKVHQQPVVVHGGLTNMVGSTETQGNELVISMEKMNKILEIDTVSKTVLVEGGVILENLHQAVGLEGLMFPVTFGAKGSAQVGGMISTNAGGLRVFRYGMTRNWVLGLEVVLADGTIISSLKKLVKDNSGLDLKQLFIGSEGTLGIITRAILKLIIAPMSRNTAVIAMETYAQVVNFLHFMEGALAGTLSGFELIWKDTYAAMVGVLKGKGVPLPVGYPFYVLVEMSGMEPEKDRETLENVLLKAFEKGLILDGTVARSELEQQQFWRIREDVDHIVAMCTHDQHFDVSLPISQIDAYILEITEELNMVPEVDRYFVYGHMADGNIHLIVSKTEGSAELKEQVNRIIYSPLRGYGGSISAEHGIGVHKKKYLTYSRSSEEITLMKLLKSTLDPTNLLNPGKIF